MSQSVIDLLKLLQIHELEDKLHFLYNLDTSYLQPSQLEGLEEEVKDVAIDFVSRCDAVLDKYKDISNAAIKESADALLLKRKEEEALSSQTNSSMNANPMNSVSPSLSKKQPFVLQKNMDSTFNPSDAQVPVTEQLQRPDTEVGASKSNSPPPAKQVNNEKSGSLENLSAPPAERKKSGGGFGIKSMLSSLTKGRPKPKRAENVPQKNADVVEAESQKDTAIDALEEDSKADQQDQLNNDGPEAELLPTQLSLDDAAPTTNIEEPVPKKYVPTNAMSALASAMRAGLSGSESNLLKNSAPSSPLAGQEMEGDKASSPPPMPTSPRPTGQQPAEEANLIPGTPPPVAVKPRPRRSSSVNENNQPAPQPPRPYTYHEGDSSLPSTAASSVAQSSPPHIMPRLSQTRSNGPPTLPRPQSRPTSAYFPDSGIPSASTANSSSADTNSPKSSVTPGLPAPRTPPSGVPILPTGSTTSRPSTPIADSPVRLESEISMSHSSGVEQVRTKEEEARYQLALKAQRSSPSKPANKPLMTPGPTLSFKKKENSTSGDDKALEKKALDWLNSKLSGREGKEPITDLYTCFADGVTMIYALEAASGQSVGKYSKKAMLQVHKLDNTTVALAFLSKLGADTQEFSPQTLLDGHKGKILSLFNVILKLFP